MDIKDNHNKFYSMELHMSNEYVSPDNPGCANTIYSYSYIYIHYMFIFLPFFNITTGGASIAY
jgi:hypothetical protein